MACTEEHGPCCRLSDRPQITFAPSPYQGPRRRNPDLVDAYSLKAEIEAQINAFRNP